MKERRSLVEGLNPEPSINSVDRSLEEHFVRTGKPKTEPASQPHEERPPATPTAEIREGKGHGGNSPSRAPLTTRVRADYAAALKRASLERQLKGITPNKLQDILEEALEPWLRNNGYLS